MRPIFALFLTALLMGGCNAGPDGTDPNGNIDGGNGDGRDAGGEPPEGEKPPFPPEQACHEVSQQASLSRKPVDIIIAIDNSGSMTAEIEGVQSNINRNFAEIIEQSGLDYRVILIAKHGSASRDQSVCIQTPLSGTTCDPLPSAPVNGERFFHYDIEISSVNALSRILSTYNTRDEHRFAPNGWSGWLRPDSAKTFIVVTDDESEISAETFEERLFNLEPAGNFGTVTDRNYVFHGIIGIRAKNPVTEAYAASEPVVSTKCDSAAKAGTRYEALSRSTGGLRFPVCETGSYDAVFRAAARDVIASAEVACEFTPPPAPEGRSYDQAYVEYVPGNGGAVQYFLQVEGAASCNGQGFTRDAVTNRITLCPDTCATLKSDETAAVAVRYACVAKID